MKGNPIRAAVDRGEVQFGTWLNVNRNPAILPILKAAGLDFVRLDMEHSSPSIETVADMALLARAIDFPIVVRPPVANRDADVLRPANETVEGRGPAVARVLIRC